MSELGKTWCFAHPIENGNRFKTEQSLDGQPFRSPIFAPMNGCVGDQALLPGQCRDSQLKTCSQDPWGYTAGELGCWGSTLCSAQPNPRGKFCCNKGTCHNLPQKPGCQAPIFRKTFPGNIVKQNFNIPTIQTLPYRLPADQIPPSKPFAWTANREIVLLRSQKPGFNLTMYKPGLV